MTLVTRKALAVMNILDVFSKIRLVLSPICAEVALNSESLVFDFKVFLKLML